jgi:hypothetical protein
MAAFQITPNSISDLWLERMAANGVKEIRLSDPSNTSRYWKDFLNSATRAGLMLLESLLKHSKRRQVYIQTGSMRLRLEKRGRDQTFGPVATGKA